MDYEINEAQSNIKKSQQKQKERHDERLPKVQPFKVGDLVLMYKSNIHDKKKLEDR